MSWRKAPAALEPAPEYIDVWYTRLDLPEQEVSRYANTLKEDEIARAKRFVFPDKYREYVEVVSKFLTLADTLLKRDSKCSCIIYTSLRTSCPLAK